MRVSVSWLRKSALAGGGGDEPEQHEHDGEPEDEQPGVHRDALQVVALLLADLADRQAGDEAEVAGHDRQHARRQERDDARAERGEDVEVAGDAHGDRAGPEHRWMVRPGPRRRPSVGASASRAPPAMRASAMATYSGSVS